MKLKGGFTVTNFLEEHNSSSVFKCNNKIFNHRNARRYINAYISKRKKEEVHYNIRDKRWTFASKDCEATIDELKHQEHQIAF